MTLAPQTRQIGVLRSSTAGVGCANFALFIDEAAAQAVVDAALHAGATHFDTADVYGDGLSEVYLGRALGSRRDQALITTKFGAAPPPDGSRPASAKWVKEACEESLKRLRTDWIDLYLLHQPDPLTPIGETLEAMSVLKNEGLVREIGCSNFDSDQLAEAAVAASGLGLSAFAAVQNSYSLLDRTADNGFVDTAKELDVSLIPYMPLASGLLTGKYKSEAPDSGRLGRTLRGLRVSDYMPGLLTQDCLAVVGELERYASEHGHTLIELALGWLVSKPYVGTVIAGATSPEQLKSNVAATFAWELTASETQEIEAITSTNVAYTWNAGFPSYAQAPPGIDTDLSPDVRVEN